MPAGRRRHPSSEILIPIALGLTAAIASVGLYFWTDTESSYPNSDEDRKKVKHHRRDRPRPPKSSRRRYPDIDTGISGGREHGPILEEGPGDFEEDQRRDEERLRLQAQANAAEAVVSGALAAEKKEPKAVEELKKEASMAKPQYMPPPAKKRTVAVVASERKALAGHDSDDEYEETGLPTSLLAHLPKSLDLSMTELNILIYSPHLSTHPLANFAETQSARRKDSIQLPSLRRASSALSSNDSTYSIATKLLPSTYPLEHILPFTDSRSITPILRSLSPEVVYIEEQITLPSNGSMISELLEGGWVGGVVIVLIGDDDEFAGLRSEDEEESPVEIRKSKGEGKWWGDSRPQGIRAKFGERVQVVEGWVLAEDWHRRIEERG